MKTFKRLYTDMLKNKQFCRIFEQECHVCHNTIKIFEKIEALGMNPETIAMTLGFEPSAIHDLRDAEYCDPYLVIELCEMLGLSAPYDCSRLK